MAHNEITVRDVLANNLDPERLRHLTPLCAGELAQQSYRCVQGRLGTTTPTEQLWEVKPSQLDAVNREEATKRASALQLELRLHDLLSALCVLDHEAASSLSDFQQSELRQFVSACRNAVLACTPSVGH